MNNRAAILFGTVLLLAASLFSPNAVAQIQVSSAVPNNATQGTLNLDVVVNGNGFKKGAKAFWFVSGTTNPGGVVVNSTSVSSSGQLTANITVAADAYVGSFDIVVRNSDGRTGKGTELFAVQKKLTQATCAIPTPVYPVVNGCSTSTAQTGCADANFGNGGLLVSEPVANPAHSALITAITQQPDGKLVAIGRVDYSTVAVARYNLDGTLDPSFGNAGISTYNFAGTASMMTRDGLLDPAGNILAVGFEAGHGFVVRFKPDGTLDPSFGTAGVFLYSNVTYESVALQPDGKIVLAGGKSAASRKDTSGAMVMRLNNNGSLDTAFGTAGISVLSSMAGFGAVKIQTVGSINYIVVAGKSTNPNGNSDFVLARLTLSGFLDPQFGMSGQITNTLCGYGGQAWALGLDPGGSIYAAGFAPVDVGGSNKIVLTKYSSIGQLDASFGDAANTGKGLPGATFLDAFGGNNSFAFGNLALETDSAGNSFVLLGSTAFPASGSSMIVSRFTTSGILDTSFGGMGVIAAGTPYGSNGSQAVMVQGDGRILSAGWAGLQDGTNWDGFAILRIWP